MKTEYNKYTNILSILDTLHIAVTKISRPDNVQDSLMNHHKFSKTLSLQYTFNNFILSLT